MNQAWSQIGPHRYRRMGELVEWIPQGTIELAHARALISVLEEMQEQYGEINAIADGTNLSPLSPEVRSYYVHASQHSLRGILIVVFGAGLLTRAAHHLLLRAGKLLYNVEAEIHHTATREEAMLLLQSRIAARRSSHSVAP